MKTTFLIASFISAGFVLSGCASVTRGMSEKVKIYTSPEDAQISTDIGMTCSSSPCTLKVSRKEKFNVTVSKEGYKTQKVHVTTEVAGSGAAAMAGNALIGGVIGVGVDAYTGAMLNHKPNPVLVELKPTNPANPNTPVGDLSHIRKQYADDEKAHQENVMRRGGGV
ncbi:PEGA domain-containing protein [Pseudovibrio sp. Alg231-02]|uniref:PEGA domain-containing protein n=1 Tax=Pseudovibrio sp. Alg231-02 TaxID=1922223 RepID=UPI000D54BF1F|nr:PEGA domain-containing protein [Pseudovibrio sp. Alg231-02]